MITRNVTPSNAAATGFRQICAWCRSDLGALTYEAHEHSYGICTYCLKCHYADLFQDDSMTQKRVSGGAHAVYLLTPA